MAHINNLINLSKATKGVLTYQHLQPGQEGAATGQLQLAELSGLTNQSKEISQSNDPQCPGTAILNPSDICGLQSCTQGITGHYIPASETKHNKQGASLWITSSTISVLIFVSRTEDSSTS